VPDAASITCADVADHADPAAREYERACTRLRSIVAELATVTAELRSTHMELRCAQHELMVTNDELRFVNHELLTAHERLLSVNEQLRTQQGERAHNRALVEAALDSLGKRGLAGATVIVTRIAAQQTRS
jgi:chromosome segregation ATPase